MRSASGSATIRLDRDAARLRLREEPQGAADLRGGARLSRLLGARSRHRHRLGADRQRRAGRHAASRRSQPRGTVIGRTRIVEVIDKGAGKGALVYTERKVTDKASGELIATVTQTTFCRADGGFGGPPRESAAGAPDPGARARSRLRSDDAAGDGADLSAERRPQSAARRSRRSPRPRAIARPILHGLGTFGVVGHALLKSVCGYDPDRAGRDAPGGSRRRCSRARPSAPKSGATATW